MELKKMTTVEEVVEYIESLFVADGTDLEDYPDWRTNGHAFEETISDFNNIEEVDQEGGEGEGDYYHQVYKIKREGYENTFIKFVGHYDSWNGVDWYEHFTITRQVEQTILVWE